MPFRDKGDILRYNPPPNWPAPPPGWTPKPGWQPKPEWGPPPAGWQLWVEDDYGYGNEPSYLPPQGPRSPTQAAKGNWFARHKVLTGVLGVILLIVVISIANSGGGDSATTAAPDASASPSSEASESPTSEESESSGSDTVQVKYEVTGSASSAQVIYSTYAGGGSGTSSNTVEVPWTMELDVEDTVLQSFTLTATNGSYEDTSATVTCKITVDGKVVAENTGSGQFSTASCLSSG